MFALSIKSVITLAFPTSFSVLRNDNISTNGNIPVELKYVLDPVYPFLQKRFQAFIKNVIFISNVYSLT